MEENMEVAMRLQPDALSLTRFAPAIEETHISVVVLVGDRAYKLKKPIALPFLDWRDRNVRQAMCHREVELNRRLAPDVYLGVADVAGSDGTPCDHLVVMRRMPPERRLSRLVREKVELRESLESLAGLIAAFHASAERSAATVEAAGRDAVLHNWNDNVASLRVFAGRYLAGAVVERVDDLAHRYLAGRGPLFEERGAAGCAIDGHGDLLADDIYLLADGPRVLDCLEFSDRLRAVDVLDDVAFLAMDLERIGAPDLAAHLLERYTVASGESHPDSLAHHYIAYRAGVRAKVACLRAEQGTIEAAIEARSLLDLAHRHLDDARVRLVLLGGLPGTGKTTLAAGIADQKRWPVLRSDVIRKELLGLAPTTTMAAPYEEGIYRPEHTTATYQALLDRARRLLERGESVILDASWTDADRRADAARLADQTSSDLVPLRCAAPLDLASQRLVTRQPGDASDASPAIAAAMAAVAHPWPEAVDIDTTCSPEQSVDDACRAVDL
jgi:aminoglycoside phosphotransferase family enzyme/predicted kinase